MKKEYLYGIVSLAVLLLVGTLVLTLLPSRKAEKKKTETKTSEPAIKPENELIPKTIAPTGKENTALTPKFEKKENVGTKLTIGAVKAIAENSITISSEGQDMTFNLTSGTTYQKSDQSQGTKTDIAVGSNVEVLSSGSNAVNIIVR